MHLLLIGCEVILRELCDAVVRSGHQVDLLFLSKGLHDQGAKAMRARIQDEIDRADDGPFHAIVLGYGLCGNGLAGIEARSKPLVLPRAHDCITLLMGDRKTFEDYFQTHPGTYFRSVGWVERGKELMPLVREQSGAGLTLDALIERYGEDNGRYLYEELTRYERAYQQLTYIETGLGPDTLCELQARDEASQRGWRFERLAGNLRLFQDLLQGRWNEEEFLVVEPGQKIVPANDDRIVRVEALAK